MSTEYTYISPYLAAKNWPDELPILFLGGTEQFNYLPISFSEIDPKSVWNRQLSQGGKPRNGFEKGIVGVLSYDESAPHRFFRVESCICFDNKNKNITITGSTQNCCDYKLNQEQLASVLSNSQKTQLYQENEKNEWNLSAHNSDQSYLNMISRALEDISSGRYYQINLIRYFTLTNPLSRADLLARMEAYDEPFSALIDIPDLQVASFSPERFVKTAPNDEQQMIEAWPIKGTMPRSDVTSQDQKNAARLVKSDKDNAELHMIVDLMRNDITQVCQSGTVNVTDSGSLKSFQKVHHLVAKISGKLRPNLTIGEFLAPLIPGGSITGAPKIEVMEAIHEYEARDRGYFMGNIFYLDDSGAFDSSILIRTVIKQGSNPYEFAAGSGIVINSEPELEMAEIEAKCRVITAPW